MINENLFWESSTKSIRNGYVFDKNKRKYTCLVCGECSVEGHIYKKEEMLVDAKSAIRIHIESSHKGMFLYLVGLDKRYNGLSDIQKEILGLMYKGLSDQEIAAKMGNKSGSTIRNHRFMLRERYKEAKVFAAIMELFEERTEKESRFVNFPASVPMQDGRVMTTEKEKEAILKQYFEDGRLLSFPRKEKKKLIILQHIARLVTKDKRYTEKEINQVLKSVYDDYVTIRRFLVDYGFLDRLPDGSQYWARHE